MTNEERTKYETDLFMFLAEEYFRRDWVMQIHYGCIRNNNSSKYKEMGPDTGFDAIGNQAPTNLLIKLLNALEEKKSLPKTIIYSLNPNYNPIIDTIIGCFQGEGTAGKIQHGSAWWFNDHISGMRSQMESLANLGNLSGFVGMLTDSRSFLSYTRHDYFRRILCEFMGGIVERDEFPSDYDILGDIVKKICYNNAVDYFNFPLEKI